MKIAQGQFIPAAQALSSTVNALPVPIGADAVIQSVPSAAALLSHEQREQLLSGLSDALSGGPPGAAGEVADTADAFAHPPHGAFSAAGYTVGLAVFLAIQRSGQLQNRPWRELVGRAGWTLTGLAGSAMRHDATDVAAAALAFLELINDGVELETEHAAKRAEPQPVDTEAWLQNLVAAVGADPHALDPIIEISAQQLTRSEDASPSEPG